MSVTNSRPQKTTNSVWRRRQCKACAAVFTSIEQIDLSASMRIRRSQGLEPFNREKLLISVYESLKHTDNASESASAITKTIINKITVGHAGATPITPSNIVTAATEVLLRFDKVAGLHYQASHRHAE